MAVSLSKEKSLCISLYKRENEIGYFEFGYYLF
jgi:hypothetical protein